jgi:hypothetical protein
MLIECHQNYATIFVEIMRDSPATPAETPLQLFYVQDAKLNRQSRNMIRINRYEEMAKVGGWPGSLLFFPVNGVLRRNSATAGLHPDVTDRGGTRHGACKLSTRVVSYGANAGFQL